MGYHTSGANKKYLGKMMEIAAKTLKECDINLYEVPKECTALSAIWMGYPHNKTIWGSDLLLDIQKDWFKLFSTINQYERVHVLGVDSERLLKHQIERLSNPVIFEKQIAIDDMWLRDSGCVFTTNKNGELAGIDLNFNGWGRTQQHTLDNQVARKICTSTGIPRIVSTVVGEGGGVIHDGEGTLIANWSSWIGSNRNPGKSRDDVAKELLRVYGAQKMIWCEGQVGADITDAHIDGVLAFLEPGLLAIHMPLKGACDLWALDVFDMHKKLKIATDAKSRKFEFIFFDQPVKPRCKEKTLLPSYLNFLVLNEAVISVSFGDDTTDRKAFDNFSQAFPNKTIEMLNLDCIYGFGGGGIHCVTQQQPTFKKK